MIYIAIDPGAGGGIAVRDEDGRIFAEPMPEGMTDIFDFLKSLVVMVDSRCIMEKTGTYMPGNSGPAAATFARHCGHLDMALYALGIPCEQVSPQTWMKSLGVPKFTGTKEGQKQLRKNWIKEKMARLYPKLKVTLKTSDCLGILTYYINKGGR